MNCADQPPPELVSDEEMTVAIYLILAIALAVVAVGLCLALLYWALPPAGQPVDTGKVTIALSALAVTSFLILFAVFGRWPGRVSSEASVDVGAPPNSVWDAFALRDDYPGWKKIYMGIDRLDERGEVYRLHYAEDSECPICSLPRDPDRSRWSSRVEILEARRPSLYRQRSFPRSLPPPDWKMDGFLESEDTTMLLYPLAGGGTRVTFESTVVRPRMWMAFLTMLGRPAKEHLRSLKAHVEGTPDETLFGMSAKRMEAARDAPRRCTCPL